MNYVLFENKRIEHSYEKLEEGKNEECSLYHHITKAIQRLKENPQAGIRIKKKLWPKEYSDITNLRKLNLSGGLENSLHN